MKLYYGKSGDIIGFSRDNVKLPGEFISIPEKDIPAMLRKYDLQGGNYKVVGETLKKTKGSKDYAKHLETLAKSLKGTLQIKLPPR
jgi:hypothetical protein